MGVPSGSSATSRRSGRRPPIDKGVVGEDTTEVVACPWALLDLARFCQEHHACAEGAAPCPTDPSPSPPAPEPAPTDRASVAGPADRLSGGAARTTRPDAR